MKDYEYRVTIIIPIYNMAEYIDICMCSLLGQTQKFSDMEILFINDGSQDNSSEIVKRYANIYKNVKLVEKENGGVSTARNLGIRIAKGKYILYLDADDQLASNTVEKVCDFFDSVYEDTDLCTYKLNRYVNGKKVKEHFRYSYFNKSGIYNIKDRPYIAQSSICVVVKNDKKHFFEEDIKRYEDQLYITRICMKKNTIGYCNEGEYQYIRHQNSAMSTVNIINMFEDQMRVFETLIKESCEKNIKYVQGVILGNWSWFLRSDLLIPYHYEGEKFDKALERIRKIIDFIDIDTILNHPDIDTFHKHYFISLKRNIKPTVIVDNNILMLYEKDIKIFERKGMQIVLQLVDAENGVGKIRGFVKSPIFSYGVNPLLVAEINGETQEVNLFDSVHSCYKSRMKTNVFYGFLCEFELKEFSAVKFKVIIDEVALETDFYMLPSVVINKEIGIDEYFRDSYRIQIVDNIIKFERLELSEIERSEASKRFADENDSYYGIRNSAIEYKKNKRVWLYVDSICVKYDNAYLQFLYDFGKNDDIERWYVWAREDSYDDMFTEEQKKYVITAGATMHKVLYLAAEYILTSFSELWPRNPFKFEREFAYFRDIAKARIIYLQHGVCHANLVYTQSAERCQVDKIVVSTYMEKENYVNKYHYRVEDIIMTGMPRYDFIDKEKKPKNRILFAPSWRAYLTGKIENNKWTIDNSSFVKSDYYTKFIDFLSNKELHKLLEEKDLYLDAKLHQNMCESISLFNIESDRIRLVSDNVQVDDYKMFITDISSYIFDFLILKRPVLYFMPDYIQFKAGMNQYRKLAIPLEKGFGELCFEANEVIKQIQLYAETNFVMKENYKKKVDELYLPMNNCRESIYQTLICK